MWLRQRAFRDHLWGADEVTSAYAGQSEGLGQAADDQQSVRSGGVWQDRFPAVRNDVHERLIHHDQAAGTKQRKDHVSPMQTGGRVGRVTHDDQVGIVRDQCRIQREVVLLPQEQSSHVMAVGRECGLWLGELRVHHQRLAPGSRSGDQGERFSGAVGDEYTGWWASVQAGQCLDRWYDIRVPGYPRECPLKLEEQPRRRGLDCNVHGEVHESGLGFAISVMTEVDRAHPIAGTALRRFQNTRALSQVTAKIAAMP
jgi:hypothetical protein